MDKNKECDVRCMCLSFAITTCPKNSDPLVVLSVANQYYKFVTGNKPDLRVVANDDKGAA